MMKTFLLAATLAAASLSHAIDLTATLRSSVQIDSGVFAYRGTGNEQGAAALDTILANTLYMETATVEGDLSDYLTYRYTVIGTYTGTEKGIVIGMNDVDGALAIGKTFTQVFGSSISESSLVSAVESAHKALNGTGSIADIINAAKAQTFLDNHKSQLVQGVGGGMLVSFSNGASVGTIVAAPVPEPASMAVLGLGAAALLRRRKRA